MDGNSGRVAALAALVALVGPCGTRTLANTTRSHLVRDEA
jgi:hypothetical protein